MKKTCIVATLLLYSIIATAQSLTGTLKHHAGQQISLTGFNYYDSYELAKTTVDSLGNFTLNYPKAYNGMAILQSQDNNRLVFVLAEKNIHLEGNHLKNKDKLQFINSGENTFFLKYVDQEEKRSQTLGCNNEHQSPPV